MAPELIRHFQIAYHEGKTWLKTRSDLPGVAVAVLTVDVDWSPSLRPRSRTEKVSQQYIT
jgi:hypothetical protein